MSHPFPLVGAVYAAAKQYPLYTVSSFGVPGVHLDHSGHMIKVGPDETRSLAAINVKVPATADRLIAELDKTQMVVAENVPTPAGLAQTTPRRWPWVLGIGGGIFGVILLVMLLRRRS